MKKKSKFNQYIEKLFIDDGFPLKDLMEFELLNDKIQIKTFYISNSKSISSILKNAREEINNIYNYLNSENQKELLKTIDLYIKDGIQLNDIATTEECYIEDDEFEFVVTTKFQRLETSDEQKNRIYSDFNIIENLLPKLEIDINNLNRIVILKYETKVVHISLKKSADLNKIKRKFQKCKNVKSQFEYIKGLFTSDNLDI